jgi:2-aminoadipate transaminase
VAPGLRVGYLLADPELIDTAVLLKQGEDFCTAGALQLVIERLIRGGVVARQETRFAAVHAAKMAAMAAGLERELAGLPVRWTRPRGGLFVWLELTGTQGHIDSDAILERAIGNGVAFIPGRYFYPDELADEDGQPHATPAPTHTLRLNFSYPPLADIPRGVAALGRTLRECL